ncbi:heparan-alpha-glucosaminide N-acetyltransferase [Oricola indica]|uniref:heparan-alpha-glucosaminide N-acetyltransferase n=1 Tax=Oricola indica TaxID=2872591 RepID=UPI003CCBF7D6
MTDTGTRPSRRIEWIDLARGVALVAMAIYHFSWDLEFFGYLDPGTAGTGPLKWFARSIASSFLILVGVSLVLAHGKGIRWRGYGKRLAMVAAAALAITVATRIATPGAYVFFGILHQIAVASVLGLLFLRLPAIALFLIAAAWISVPFWGKTELFSHPLLLWIGLSPFPPRSNDFVPVFPWFGAVLTGMAIGRLLIGTGATTYLADHPPHENIVTRALRFIGRHSLVTYLVHQPVLIACVYLFSLVSPPAEVEPEAAFIRSCTQTCVEQYSEQTCRAFCECAVAGLKEEGLFERVFTGEINQTTDPRVADVSDRCSLEANTDGN